MAATVHRSTVGEAALPIWFRPKGALRISSRGRPSSAGGRDSTLIGNTYIKKSSIPMGNTDLFMPSKYKKKGHGVQKKIKFFDKNMPSKKGNDEAGNL